jgi:preprotein translocase subunit SecB
MQVKEPTQWLLNSLKMEKTNKSGYKILAITIPKTIFEYEGTGQEELEIKLNISTSHRKNNNLLIFDLKAEISLVAEGKDIGNIFILVKGNFEKFGEADLLFDDFVAVNAPAILYPYLREHLATLSLKAGLSVIVLEPMNFAALAKK